MVKVKIKKVIVLIILISIVIANLPIINNVQAVFTASDCPYDIQFTEISAGERHNLAIDSSGNIWAWGSNNKGQLGNGSTTNSNVPIQITTGKRYTKVFAGYENSMAIDSSNNLWAWGRNDYGQLGNNSTTNISSPTQIKSGIKEVALGQSHTLAIDTSNNMWAWGRNNVYQLGNGETTDSTTPIKIKSGMKAVSAGWLHSIALDTSGNLYSWGDNTYGSLGNGTVGGSTTDHHVPTIVKSGTRFTKISTKNYHNLAIGTNGRLYSWGRNENGELGRGLETLADMDEPVIIETTSTLTFTEISAGYTHSMAIDSEGNLWGWGQRKYWSNRKW